MKQDQTEQHLSIAEIIKLEKRFRAFRLQKWCGCDFAHDNGQNPDATDKMYRYADNFEELLEDGIGMTIYGGPGAGKSHAAAEIVNELTDRGYSCFFTNMNTVVTELNTMGFEGRRNFLNQICDKDLLVLDDLGSEMETPYCNQIFIQIVNTCLARNIPIIITTPFHQDVLTAKEGNNAKRVMAITRLLQRNINYTVLMPGARRSRNLQQKRKMEALVKGGTVADQQALAFEEAEAETNETTVAECLPETVEQTLPFENISEKEK